MDKYEYVSKFKTLITRERNAEIEFHTEEIKSLKPFAREKKGRALLDMVKQSFKREGESVFRFVKMNGEKLPHNEFAIGTNVLISSGRPLEHHLKGVVMQKSGMHLDVYVQTQSNMLQRDRLRIDVYVNDTTYQAQLQILDNFKEWALDKRTIREVLLHEMRPRLGKGGDVEYFDELLNESQKLAVSYALQEDDFYLIQGPPGTGKTKTSIEIVRQLIKQGKSVLVSADSNVATDNIMLGLVQHTSVIRIGESPKISEEIEEHTLQNMVKQSAGYRVISEGEALVKKYREEQRKHTMPTKKNSAGVSHFQIVKMAEREQSGFGMSVDTLKSMAKWIKFQEKIKFIHKKLDGVRRKVMKGCIDSASVICTTNTTAGSHHLDGITFDAVLIDEAGQSTEPSCLIPISKAKKVILVGDHKQLPPTILSRNAQELSVSLFERMFGHCRYTLLDTQYRMHPLINQFPSDEFYEGKLKTYSKNVSHVIKDPVFEKNVVFIDVKGVEKKFKGATSYYNVPEVDRIMDLVEKYAKHGVKAEDIGVISPYNEQVRKLQERMPFVEVHSIDGFQGREKKVIIISLVRCNGRGEIGFLKDLRRLNVALTRAICELVVIGDEKTICSNATYRRFVDFVKKDGTYISKS
ncbi:IGHMBP2 family helicase [Candidatus Woesearchaeota archaeon]|nr:IGHMBP2 family helicase [Candidatus Woesearchaeota archaeon]